MRSLEDVKKEAHTLFPEAKSITLYVTRIGNAYSLLGIRSFRLDGCETLLQWPPAGIDPLKLVNLRLAIWDADNSQGGEAALRFRYTDVTSSS